MTTWKEIPEIELYSDGGAEPNPGKGGFGVILSYKGRRKEFYKGYRLTTNNRMELMGVIFGLERLKTKSKVDVYTDSKYVIDGIELGWAVKWRSNNWIRKKNERAINHDLWARLLELIEKQEQVKFHWVKGHAGHLENERCDQLAGFGIHSDQLLEDEGYEPNSEQSPSTREPNLKKSKVKIEKEGDSCRKCGTSVIVRKPKKRKLKPSQTYYFEWYLSCPNCGQQYMVEAAKRQVKDITGLF